MSPMAYRLTPPDSPEIKARLTKPAPAFDDETLGLIGTTKFEPRTDVKNIMITGGAGFM